MNAETKQIVVIALTAAIAAVLANHFIGPALKAKL